MIDIILQFWGWTGLKPAEIIGTNSFGNMIVRDHSDRFWRICPEELSCEPIAENREKLVELSQDEEFVLDWEMHQLVDLARGALGDPEADQCYCLKIPAVLGGEYSAVNFGTISVSELISFAGRITEQIKDLPDGSKIDFKFVE